MSEASPAEDGEQLGIRDCLATASEVLESSLLPGQLTLPSGAGDDTEVSFALIPVGEFESGLLVAVPHL